tara:strand:+ start:114 stop:299 length:186 start_codon:yes stop_codon:yes gene_type:complete
MKSYDTIKEGNVLWRIDFLGQFDAPTYSFSLDDAHKIARTHGSQPYIVTMVRQDNLQQEIK